MRYAWIELQKTEIIDIFLSISNQYFQVTLLRSILCKPCISSPSMDCIKIYRAHNGCSIKNLIIKQNEQIMKKKYYS